MNRRILCALTCLGALAASAVGAQTAVPAAVHVDAPWARPTVQGQKAGGAFVQVTNTGKTADKLLGGSTPVADRVELHSMRMEGETMQMREVPAIELPPGQTVALKPGGYHLMFQGLKAPMKAGDTVPLTLRFEKAREVKVNVPVSLTPPANVAASGHAH